MILIHRVLKVAGVVGYFIFLHAFYYILLVPAFAEYSFYAFLFVPLVVLGIWLVPKSSRPLAVILTFLYVFVDQALSNVRLESTMMILLAALVLILFLYPLLYWYTKQRMIGVYVAIAVIVSLSIQLVVPPRTMQMLSELTPIWVSKQQYVGEFYGRLPMQVTDVDGDGLDEIVTLGNRDFYEEGRELPIGYDLYDEPLRVMAWEWDHGQIVRVPDSQLDLDHIAEWLPSEYIGFPYYVVNDQLEIEPLVDRVSYTSAMVQFGSAPYQAMILNLENLKRQLELREGAFDTLTGDHGAFHDLVLRNGVLSGSYLGEPFTFPTHATQISAVVRLANGSEGLLLKGYAIDLLQFIDGQPVVTHTIDRTMRRDLSFSNLMAADVDGDDIDEILIGYPYPAILEPETDGSWRILWAVDDSSELNISYRFLDLAQFEYSDAATQKPEIIAFSKSLVRASQIHYLTSFTYTDEGLKQNWKVFNRGIDRAAAGDLDGDGSDELVIMYSEASNLYVFKKHNIPITTILIVLTTLLYAGLIGRRVMDAYRKRNQA